MYTFFTYLDAFIPMYAFCHGSIRFTINFTIYWSLLPFNQSFKLSVHGAFLCASFFDYIIIIYLLLRCYTPLSAVRHAVMLLIFLHSVTLGLLCSVYLFHWTVNWVMLHLCFHLYLAVLKKFTLLYSL